MMLNDLLIVAPLPEPRMWAALHAIDAALHPAFDRVVPPGKSKESCVLCSLAVRDFLWRAGWKDATCTTVYMMIVATDPLGNEIWSLGVGDHTNIPTVDKRPMPDTAARWSGHMVVEVPSAGIMIDTTMFPAKREHWPNLPGMVAVQIQDGPISYGLKPLAGMADDDDRGRVQVVWLRQPNKRWQGAPDTDRARRLPVVKALLGALGVLA